MLDAYYISLGGNAESIASALPYVVNTYDIELLLKGFKIEKPFVVVLPSYNDGFIEEVLEAFMESEGAEKLLLGFIGTGNLNFGVKDFCITAKRASSAYKKPLFAMLDYRGTSEQLDELRTTLRNTCDSLT